MLCGHCGDQVGGGAVCGLCEAVVAGVCLECHHELVHGVIDPTGVHIVGHGPAMGHDRYPEALDRAAPGSSEWTSAQRNATAQAD